MDLLEKLDASRHDSMAILDTANEFGNLTDAEQDGYLASEILLARRGAASVDRASARKPQ